MKALRLYTHTHTHTTSLSKEKGITLIALVITIIVLLILAGVTIATLMGDNGIITKAREAKQKTEDAQKEEEAILSDIEDYMNGITVSEEGFNEDAGVNEPKLKSGMIPVYYDESAKVWKKADETNTGKQWYDYDAKKWANIITVSDEDKELREVEVGKEIPMDKITTFFVWIPRYAYRIVYFDTPENAEAYRADKSQTTGIIGYSDARGIVDAEGKTPSDLQDPVTSIGIGENKLRTHPAFETDLDQGGWSNKLEGIWVAKYEAIGLLVADAADSGP